MTTNLSKILGAIKSYSAFQTFCKVKGEDEGKKLMQDIKDRYVESGDKFRLKLYDKQLVLFSNLT